MAVGSCPWRWGLHTIYRVHGWLDLYDKRLAKAGGRGWVGSRYLCRVRSVEVGWRRLGGASRDGFRCSLFLGASRPTSPVAEVTTAIASVLKMLRAARVSIPLTILSDSQYALGVVLGEDRALSKVRLVQLARSEARCYRQRAGIEGRHVAAHRRLADNEAADRSADAGRRRWMVPERAAALISCAPSFPPESEVPFLTLAGRIFWQGIQDEVDPLRLFRPGRQCSRGCGPYLRVRQCPHAASLRAQCGFSIWSSCHDRAARRSR